MSPAFGELVTNPHASEDNPRKHGYFVREGVRKGRLNPGRYYELTDGKGDFWTIQKRDVESDYRTQSPVD